MRERWIPVRIKDIKQTLGAEWLLCDDPEVDIAIIPFGYYDQAPENAPEISFFMESDFLPFSKLTELYDVYSVVFEPGAPFAPAALLRSGTISHIDRDKKGMLVDVDIRKKNSGNPVLVKPSNLEFTRSGGGGAGKISNRLVGVVTAYRAGSGENTGLSVVWHISHLTGIIESEEFGLQLEKVRDIIGSGN